MEKIRKKLILIISISLVVSVGIFIAVVLILVNNSFNTYELGQINTNK